MDKLIAMLVICWVPQHDATLKEVWRIEKQVPLSHCLEMNRVAARGGRAGVIVVACDPVLLPLRAQ